MKPFKPPTLLHKLKKSPVEHTSPSEPPSKRRRTSSDLESDRTTVAKSDPEAVKQRPDPSRCSASLLRKPLNVLANQSTSSQPTSEWNKMDEALYTVLWRKITTKKNKTWDGDGILSVSGGYASLRDVSGREMGKTAYCGLPSIGDELSMSGKDVKVEAALSKSDFLASRQFLGSTKSPSELTRTENDGTAKVCHKTLLRQNKLAQDQKEQQLPGVPVRKSTKTAFRTPLLYNTVQATEKDRKVPLPRHDPKQEGALVMKRPKLVPRDRQIVDVVVDPLLTRHLREHQRTGVMFLYECVMGMRPHSGEGAILADEMGLGKTLQTIALLWTLLKQNPISEEPPVVKKALIVCPVTLINNWRKEFRKWLGNERLGVFVAENKHSRLTDFTFGKSYSVMIVGYEKLQRVQVDLQKGAGIDIVIADEGHRLKTAQNKSAQAIKSLNTERRIILSGTPIQNDLAEFYTMVDFVNPGLLNKYSNFKRDFETPILKSRQPGASVQDLEKGEARSEELASITSAFILRRTAEILSQYLPPKTEYVLFCRPTKTQSSVYNAIIGSPSFNAALGSSAISLELINVLKKVCNSPNLLLQRKDASLDGTKLDVLDTIPSSFLKSPGASGKLQVLDSLLHRIHTTTDEKLVLVSNYTSTMDILGQLLASLSYKYLRLDGTTPTSKRQDLVDRFNRTPRSNSFVFLLSAKAGGVGLNLIGASRLVLFDIDWNPATDLQAMARVHRDGQKRPCFIYRLLTQGALDEKIFQRQVSKTGLADSIVDGKTGVSGFTREELRDLFAFDAGDGCMTHKLLGCGCGGRGVPLTSPRADSDGDTGELHTAGYESEAEAMELDPESDLLRKKSDWKPASAFDWEIEEAEARRKAKEFKDSAGKTKMLSLMQYTHLDTALVGRSLTTGKDTSGDNAGVNDDLADIDAPEDRIEDAVLQHLVREDGGRIGYLFTKVNN